MNDEYRPLPNGIVVQLDSDGNIIDVMDADEADTRTEPEPDERG